MENQSVYDVVSARIIALLESGTVPWHKPWASQTENSIPRNLVSRKSYRGVNAFLLHAMNCGSPYWLTFKQAQALGGHVRKGERSTPVVFWKWLETDELDEQGKTKRVPLLRYYSAFNVTQCEGIDAPIQEGKGRENTPIEAARQIVEAMPKRPEIRYGMDRAFYSPALDFVAMPELNQFERSEDFHSVLFHELTHATGHESRLNRKGVAGSEGEWSAFGSTPYAREELVAEMGAAFLCGHAGIVDRVINNSAAYVANWLERLRNDTKLVVIAAAQAQRAADFILNVQHSTGEEN